MNFKQLFRFFLPDYLQHLVMIAVGFGVDLSGFIAKEYEAYLSCLWFCAILNIPLTSALTQIDQETGKGIRRRFIHFYEAGMLLEIFRSWFL